MNRHDSISDEALIEAIHKGDGVAAAGLYRRHVDRVHRICCRILLDPAQVPDCVQEVWMRVFRHLGRFRCQRRFVTWLNSVAANTAIDYYRKWKRQRDHRAIAESCLESQVADEPMVGQQLDDEIVRRRVQEALGQISVNQRTAFVLRYFEDMSVSEIARTLGCNEGTVRTHIHRSLVALRTKLTEVLRQ